MNIYTDLQQFKSTDSMVLTIGNFDGMHLGHQAVVQKLKQQPYPNAIVTFANHPSKILHNSSPLLLCTREHKLHLLKSAGVNNLFLLPFTQDLSQLSAEKFLQLLKKSIPFRQIVLGHDAVIGHNREGNAPKIRALAKDLGFDVQYIEPIEIGTVTVSSTVIRNLILEGNLECAASYLGRNYSIFSKVQKGLGKGKALGYPTVNIHIDGLCTPPCGVYSVDVLHHHKNYQGIANLGFAPTVKSIAQPLLEVHILDCNQNFYEQEIEVIFKKFIRCEKRFNSLDELKNQIKNDIAQL